MNNRIIVALDTPGYDSAKKLVEQLGDIISFYKVGLELFISDGDRVLDMLKELNKRIFLDLKLHDIPNTVKRAVSSISAKGVSLATCHTSGGFDMMKAAADSAQENDTELDLIGVTVLTSINEDILRQELLNQTSIPKMVVHLAGLARDAGLKGIVASALELPLLREHFDNDFLIVTPGIRPSGSDIGDQKRVVTPKQAFDNGASYIVVGRPINAASNPYDAASKIIDEIC